MYGLCKPFLLSLPKAKRHIGKNKTKQKIKQTKTIVHIIFKNIKNYSTSFLTKNGCALDASGLELKKIGPIVFNFFLRVSVVS